MERVNPIMIRNPETGEVEYTLDFNRKTVAKMERAGVSTRDMINKPLTGAQDFFFYAFLMHHPYIKQEKTNEILDELGGITNEELFRALMKLHEQAIIVTGDGERKNARFVLEI